MPTSSRNRPTGEKCAVRDRSLFHFQYKQPIFRQIASPTIAGRRTKTAEEIIQMKNIILVRAFSGVFAVALSAARQAQDFTLSDIAATNDA